MMFSLKICAEHSRELSKIKIFGPTLILFLFSIYYLHQFEELEIENKNSLHLKYEKKEYTKQNEVTLNTLQIMSVFTIRKKWHKGS